MSIEEGRQSCGMRLKKHHSVLEVFANFNCYVPRILAACIVYAKFTMLFALCGRFFIQGSDVGTMIGQLFGASIGLNLLGKVLYLCYGSSQKSINSAKKN
jgi:hypothetical protein